MATQFDFHQLITTIKVDAAEITGLIVFLIFLGRALWHEIKPLVRKR